MDKLGPTGLRLTGRLNELRLQRGHTLSSLEAKLVEVGRPIQLSALSKIEKGQRRVDADDLVALAIALDVSPNSLLLPSQDPLDQDVEITPTTILSSEAAWNWASKDWQSPKRRRGIFVSYTQIDEKWANWISWQLLNAGYEVAFDSWDLGPGDNIRSYIEECIDRSACVVVVNSENYSKSDWATTELTLALRKAQLAILPIMVDKNTPSIDSLSVRQWIRIDDKSESDARSTLIAAIAKLGIRSRPVKISPPFPSTQSGNTNYPLHSITPISRTIIAFESVELVKNQSNAAKANDRNSMVSLVDQALNSAGFSPEFRDRYIDRGNCLIALIRASDGAPKTWLLTKFAPKLNELLTELNAKRDNPLRIKAVIHPGDITFDELGYFGEDLDIALGLLDAVRAGHSREVDDGPLTIVISEQIHRSTVRHGYASLEESDFQPVKLQGSYGDQRAWIQKLQ